MNNPIQPLVIEQCVVRFKANEIVRLLLQSHPSTDMNRLATLEFSDDDRRQFAQLIGYSLSGYGDLPYVDDLSYNTAAQMLYGADERDARIEALERELATMRAAIDRLRAPFAELIGRHPDDLSN